jgi:hypothetical protein
VEVSEHTCSCSLSIPPEDVPNHYCIKVAAAGYTCSGSFGNSCIQYLDSLQSKFCVQLTPVRTSNGYNPVGNALFSTSSVTFHQTQVIVVTASDQTCMSDAVVKVSDCGTRETLGTFTTTSENCATSFALPTSKTHYCMNVFAANYTCSGNISSDCSSGPIEVPDNNANGTTYEVIMKSVLGTVELHLNASESIYKELSATSIMYSLINQNGQVDETKISDSNGVSFPSLPVGEYSISYQAIPGYTCGGNLVEGNRCTTETVSCMSNSKTTITYNIERVIPKPTNKPASFHTTPLKSAVVIRVINGELPTSGVQVSIVAAGKPNEIVDTCTTSGDGKCSFSPESSEISFTATITPPKGTICQDSCTIEMILKPGQNPEYAIVLVPSESTAIVIVIMDKKPVPGVLVEYFISGSPDKIVETSTTTAEGKSTFIAEDSTMEYTAKVTPPEGMNCQESCTFEMTMKPGETPEYNVALTRAPSRAIVYVVQDDKPVTGVLVEYFIPGSPDKIIGANTTTADGRSTFSSEGPAMEYTAKVTPPKGINCQDSCIFEMTMTPGETPEYNVVLAVAPSTAIVYVVQDDKPIPGVQVEYFITGSPDKIIRANTTTTDGRSTFSSEGPTMDYTAKVTPPEGLSCQDSCTFELTMKPGETHEYTVVLALAPSTAVVYVVQDDKPVPGVQVEYFITGSPDKSVGANTTTTDGRSKFSSESPSTGYTAKVIPPEGMKCQDLCTVEMTMKPGKNLEYKVVLIPSQIMAIVKVIMNDKPVAGVKVDYSISGSPDKIIGTSSTTLDGESNFLSESAKIGYTASVTPPEGTTCQNSCAIDMALKLGGITEYTVVLVPTKSNVKVNVLKDNKPVPGVKVNYFVTGKPNQIIGSETTTTEGKSTFSVEGAVASITAVVTPPEGASCQESCSVIITMTPGETSEYTVLLMDEAATLIIKVEYKGESVAGAQVNFSIQNSLDKIQEACTLSKSITECELTAKNNFDAQYFSTVIPPTGYICPETGCSAGFTMVPGKTLDYTFTLIKEIMPTGEAVVSVLYSGLCLEGAKVEIFDTNYTATLLQSFITTSSVCNMTFTTVNLDVVYRAIVTPPIGPYLCSGNFDSSCSATFKVVAAKVTIVQCILIIITQPPVTFSPTQKPAIPPTPKPTNKPTMLPVKPPTPKPTLKPTKLPAIPPTPIPTMLPMSPPTPKPTMKPTKLPVDPPTLTPTTISPLQRESTTVPPTINPVVSPATQSTKGPVSTSTKKPSTMLPVQEESSTMVPTPIPVTPLMSKSTKKPKTFQTAKATASPIKVGKSTKTPTKSLPPSSAKSKLTTPTNKPVSSTVFKPTRKVGATISNDNTVKIKGK